MSLKNSTKYFYGLGFVSVGIKDVLYTLFVFFYYNQILGLDPLYTGLATFIALFFDAFSDPIIGFISDNHKSKKLGRRHPFMFLSAIPIGLSTWLLFVPPQNFNEIELFCWLTFFSIVVRFFLTLFIVPAMSLGAELSSDYHERTQITSFRISFTTLLQPFIFLLGVYVFFVPEEGMITALENKSSYPPFAFYCGCIMTLCILLSTYGTINIISKLPSNSKKESFKKITINIKKALKMESFKSLLFYTAIVFTAFGIGNTITTYLLTYIFEFDEVEIISILFAGALGGLISLFAAPKLGKLFDKKNAAIICTFIFSLGMTLPYILRLLNFFPSNDNPFLIYFVFVIYFCAFTFLWSAMSLSNSMMAEVADQFETQTNTRQEGLFFSTISLAYKCTVGLGYLGGGIILKLISFPNQISLNQIDSFIINNLTIAGGPVLFIIYISSIFFLKNYTIDQNEYENIRKILKSKN